MKKNLLALLMGTMVVASLVVGCGEKPAETKEETKTEATDEKKDDAKEEKADDAKEEKADDAEEADDADVEETADDEDADLVYADLSAELADSSWVSTDGEIWVFGEDGATFGVSDGEDIVYGSYSLEMITDGEDVLMGLTMSVDEIGFEAFYFVTDIDTDNGALYLLDEDGNESALVEAE